MKRNNNKISHIRPGQKGNFRRKTKSLLIATQNSPIRTNYVNAKIDNTQQKSKCRLCGDRDENKNHIISECNKLTQREYKTRHDWMGNVTHEELCKKLKFDPTIKCMCINQNPSRKIRWIKFSRIFRNKRITLSRP